MRVQGPKKAYLASTFSLAENRIPEIERTMREVGWEVIDRWWYVDEKLSLPTTTKEFYADPIVQAIAARHWMSIRDADILVLVADEIKRTRFTGAAVEYGYALAIGKPCIVVGEAKLSAMWANAVHCKSLTEFRRVLLELNYDNDRGEF